MNPLKAFVWLLIGFVLPLWLLWQYTPGDDPLPLVLAILVGTLIGYSEGRRMWDGIDDDDEFDDEVYDDE